FFHRRQIYIRNRRRIHASRFRSTIGVSLRPTQDEKRTVAPTMAVKFQVLFSHLVPARASYHGRPDALPLPEFPLPRLRTPRPRNSPRGRLGKQPQYRLLDCRPCRARFLERKGTPRYRAHLPEGTVFSILHHIAEGCGVLKSSRLVHLQPDTVSRYS